MIKANVNVTQGYIILKFESATVATMVRSVLSMANVKIDGRGVKAPKSVYITINREN